MAFPETALRRRTLPISVAAVLLVSIIAVGIFWGKWIVQREGQAAAISLATYEKGMASLERTRKARWAAAPEGKLWDIVYTGIGTPSDVRYSPQTWDNPIDDDWRDPRVSAESYALNVPQTGYLTVNRNAHPDDERKTGNIWRHDEALTNAQALTIEVAVQLKPESDPGAFFIALHNDMYSGALLLSPNGFRFGRVQASTSTENFVRFNTTDKSHVYRIVKEANSSRVTVYVDGKRLWYGELPGPSIKRSNIIYSLLVGDNSNDPNFNASYVLNYVKYRRGAFPPTKTLTPVETRTPPPLPSQHADKSAFPKTGRIDGTAIPVGLRGTPAAWRLRPNGILELNTKSAANINSQTIFFPTGLSDKGDFTLEARINVLADSDDRGFAINHFDRLGGISLVLSPTKAELFQGGKPVGSQAVKITSGYHTYRLVRVAKDKNGLVRLAHLYIDNNPVPIIVDQRLSGVAPTPQLQIGDFEFPNVDKHAHVLIDYITWQRGAYAPPRPSAAPDQTSPAFAQQNIADAASERVALDVATSEDDTSLPLSLDVSGVPLQELLLASTMPTEAEPLYDEAPEPIVEERPEPPTDPAPLEPDPQPSPQLPPEQSSQLPQNPAPSPPPPPPTPSTTPTLKVVLTCRKNNDNNNAVNYQTGTCYNNVAILRWAQVQGATSCAAYTNATESK